MSGGGGVGGGVGGVLISAQSLVLFRSQLKT